MAVSNSFGGLPEHAQKTINEIQDRIREQESQLLEKKRGVNALLAAYNRPPFYTDLELKPASASGPIRRDQFYGQPLASVVREVLTRRRAADQGPASVNEIYEAMLEGGYRFEAKDEENAKRGLRISLAKNTATFHKLPTGHYGLTEWYPAAKEVKAKSVQEPEANGEPAERSSPDAPQARGEKGAQAKASTTGKTPEQDFVPPDEDFGFEDKEKREEVVAENSDSIPS